MTILVAELDRYQKRLRFWTRHRKTCTSTVPDARRGRCSVANAALFLSAGCSAATPHSSAHRRDVPAGRQRRCTRGRRVSRRGDRGSTRQRGRRCGWKSRSLSTCATSRARQGALGGGRARCRRCSCRYWRILIGAFHSHFSRRRPPRSRVLGDGGRRDQLTARGLPLVFRVGADGADLGGNSARFLVEQIGPRLHACRPRCMSSS